MDLKKYKRSWAESKTIGVGKKSNYIDQACEFAVGEDSGTPSAFFGHGVDKVKFFRCDRHKNRKIDAAKTRKYT